MERYRLLILGAGASGIAAASKFLENGFNDFKILEAENRIGGRINTVSFGDEFVELGAEWIHGESGNVVFELASKYGLADNSTPLIQFENTNFFDYSGRLIKKNISKELLQIYNELLKFEKELMQENLNEAVGTYFETEYKKRITALNKTIHVDDDLSKKFLKVFEHFTNSIDGSDSWYESSVVGQMEYWECPGNSLVVWTNRRYDIIFELLQKNIPKLESNKSVSVDDKILLNKEVVKIKWNDECLLDVPDIEVECSDGSKFYAEHILITCSLGVLKDKAGKLFSPSLPSQKLKCIENLGYGTVDKIFVTFENKWWGDDINGFCFLWSDEEIKNDVSGWLNGVIFFHPITPTSNILRGWVTSKAAHCMESLSNQEMVEGLNFLFDKFLGSTFCVLPIKSCLSSRWYSNPHFKGSYSFRLLKSESANVWASQLAEPVCNQKGKPVLLFGGEATHDHYYSSVHGAVESGQREATRLLPLLFSLSNVLSVVGPTVIVGDYKTRRGNYKKRGEMCDKKPKVLVIEKKETVLKEQC